MITEHPCTLSRSSRARLARRLCVLVGAVLFAAAGTSYTSALMAPGYASWQDKTSSWIRDHGGASVIDRYENWRYRHPPSNRQPDMTRYTGVVGIAGGTTTATVQLPTLPTLPGSPPATWSPGRPAYGGGAASYTTVYQPDPAHRSVLAGVAVIAASAVRSHLVSGTAEPPGVHLGASQVPSGEVRSLVAVFNSGFKMNDTAGGYYHNGVTMRPLVDGQASAVIDDRGHLDVAQWGRDITMNPHIAAVRQNLALIVEGGQPVAGLEINRDLRWGSAKNQLQYTARSGLGVTAAGDLVYVAGNRLNLSTLARALADAGAVRGMQLDIHDGMTFFSSWSPDQAGQLAPTLLLPDMHNSPDRYLAPDRRDFFYLTVRPRDTLRPWARSAAATTPVRPGIDTAATPNTPR